METQLTTETGTVLSVRLRTLKVREYPNAFAAHERDEEWRLIALCAEPVNPPLDPDWPLSLAPVDYERAWAIVQGENPGFFAWSARRLANRGVREGVARMVAQGLASPSGGVTPLPRSRPTQV